MENRSFICTACEIKVFHTCSVAGGEENPFRGDFQRDWGYFSESVLRQGSVRHSLCVVESAAIVGSTEPQSDCEGKGKSGGQVKTNLEDGEGADCKRKKKVFHSCDNSEVRVKNVEWTSQTMSLI